MINADKISQLVNELHEQAHIKFPSRTVGAFLPDEL